MNEKRELVIPLKEDENVSRRVLTIPNALSLLRIVLIPFFVWFYLKECYTGATVVIIISGVSDFLDGKIARKFHLITKVGKILDPVSDKLTQCAMIFCLAARYPLMVPVIVLFVCKEGFMGIMGAILLKSGRMLNGAMWYGKVCTAVLYVVLIILIVFPQIPLTAANAMLAVCAAFMLYSVARYIGVYWRIFHS